MAVSLLTLAWLLLAQAPPPGDLVPINSRGFAIPVSIADPAQRAQIKSLILYVSADEGKNWTEAGHGPPDQQQFRFTAPNDGPYWFSVVVVDLKDNRIPPDPYKMPPNQKILVDTQPPQIKTFAADRQSEEFVNVSWEIQEEHPDLASLRLEYRPADAPTTAAWNPVPLSAPALKGEAHFRVSQPGAVTVRLEIKDTAGNVTPKEATVAAANGSSIAAVPLQSAPAVPPQPAPAVSAAPSPTAGTPPAVPNSVAASGPPPAPITPIARDGWSPGAAPGPLPAVTGPREIARGGVRGEAIQPVSASGPAYGSTSASPANSSLPRPQMVNERQITLEYEVKCGNSGVRQVELWITKDDGRTWDKLTDDPDLKSPITATLPGEGVFGLRLVVESGAGLSKGPPQPGDAPDMRIEVDLSPPELHLYEPQPDPYQRDALVINWNASDRNLAPRPVKLEYAEKPEGPWLTIAADLPPIGSHTWPLPKNVAYKVYLRAVAVDAAENRTVAETRDPVLIDLIKPEARPLRLVVTGHKPGPETAAPDSMVRPAGGTQSVPAPVEAPPRSIAPPAPPANSAAPVDAPAPFPSERGTTTAPAAPALPRSEGPAGFVPPAVPN